LVATVCEGVERFRPHCTRPGEQRSQHLRQGGGEVCDQGDRYGAKAVICSRWHLFGAGNVPEFLAKQAASEMASMATTPFPPFGCLASGCPQGLNGTPLSG
jgi:hypothetical protein